MEYARSLAGAHHSFGGGTFGLGGVLGATLLSSKDLPLPLLKGLSLKDLSLLNYTFSEIPFINYFMPELVKGNVDSVKGKLEQFRKIKEER